jgi:hypothetical protein
MHTTTKDKIKARIKAWTISISFMLGCFFMIWALTVISDQMNDKVTEEAAEGIKNQYTQLSAIVLS